MVKVEFPYGNRENLHFACFYSVEMSGLPPSTGGKPKKRRTRRKTNKGRKNKTRRNNRKRKTK